MQQTPYSPPPPHRAAPPAQIRYLAPPRRPRRWNSFWRNGCIGCCLGNVFSIVMMLCLFAGGTAFYAASPPETRNILVLGMDTRPGTGEDKVARTDTIMVLSVNPRQRVVSVFSLPRDVFITSPTYGTLRANTIVRTAELDRPGTGIGEMIASLEYTFGFEIHYYARVSFEGFTDVVDALGGVEIDVPKHIVDYEYPTPDYGTMLIEFQPGKQHMDGETALVYARTRHADSDYERAERQQQVISAVMNELTNPLNFYRYPGVMVAFVDNIETDMHAIEMAALTPGILLYAHSPDQVERFVVDRNYVYGGEGGVQPDVNRIRPWIETHMQ